MPQPNLAISRAAPQAWGRPGLVIVGLAIVALLLCIGFMTIGARGNWDFILAFRGRKLLALALVGWAVAVSTVAFQTATQNRILTPAIMGFDALYILLQTLLVFVFGSLTVITFNHQAMFVLEVIVMCIFSGAIYGFLFLGGRRNLHLVMLVGVVLGVLFRSLTDFFVRMIDPNEFASLQDLFYAGFNAVQTDLLALSFGILVLGTVFAISRFAAWDVLALGRDNAINLGVNYNREVLLILALVTIFISVSTALVGPITFFGLLVANLAYLITPSYRHAHIMPVALLLAIICLVGGQMALERLFAFNTSLSIIVEFAGGLTFIILLLRGTRK